MSIADEILRLQNAKIDIKVSIENKGVNVPNNETIDNYNTYINQIQTGGGGGNADLIDVLERDITSINIPSGTTQIGGNALAYCTNLESVTIPNTVTSIGNGAFQNCYALTSITLPNGLRSLGLSPFSGCRNLTSLTLPESLQYVGMFAISDNFTSITFLGTTPPTFEHQSMAGSSSNLVVYVPAESLRAYAIAIEDANPDESINIQPIPTA